ncbi:hypothetical protein [Amycolatopsis alkalitolerans]|uniref:Uncharacterized protein n=1 Tax=Amycolatopsis alkalitolerans TaxID=2547244 RepID=A0A5C4M7K4_9PSEU|nr:hypothetical protein [Amycolatopsis alkalitolerans]TNC28031.1 hypothetical protein FG385_06250 [Amycolatopsis alkalitolerans]
MSEFASELHRGILEAQQAAQGALDTGHPYEAYLYRARLADLLEMAGRHGVDTSALVDAGVREELAEDEAALRE